VHPQPPLRIAFYHSRHSVLPSTLFDRANAELQGGMYLTPSPAAHSASDRSPSETPSAAGPSSSRPVVHRSLNMLALFTQGLRRNLCPGVVVELICQTDAPVATRL